jgi:5-methylcytosine-specific restriction endonuclease McrA
MVMHITSLKRALCLLFRGSAKVVDDEYNTYDFDSWRELGELQALEDPDQVCVSTPNFRMAIPEVIQLVDCQRFPPKKVKFSRRNIFLRDNYQCQYCGVKPAMSELTIDHVLPRAQGGKTSWENVVLACTSCNTSKGNRTPEQAKMKMRSVPKRPNWLSCTLHSASRQFKPTWSKFIDSAYWDVSLNEE